MKMKGQKPSKLSKENRNRTDCENRIGEWLGSRWQAIPRAPRANSVGYLVIFFSRLDHLIW